MEIDGRLFERDAYIRGALNRGITVSEDLCLKGVNGMKGNKYKVIIWKILEIHFIIITTSMLQFCTGVYRRK